LPLRGQAGLLAFTARMSELRMYGDCKLHPLREAPTAVAAASMMRVIE